MHPWLNTNLYPFKLNSIEVEGDKLSYIDEGKGDVLIFMHGNFEWSLCWKQVIQNLKTQYRCIAFDQLGFGLSEKPRHADYSFQASTRRLELFIDKLGLRNVTLVPHTTSGIIALNYAVHFPEVVKNVVMLNAGIKFWGDEPLLKSKYKKLLGKYRKVFSFSSSGLVDEFLPDVKDKKDIFGQYQQVYKDKNALTAAISYVDQMVYGEFWYNGFKLRIGRLKSKPVTLIRLHSASNNTISEDEEWKKALPGMKILTIEGQSDLYHADSSIVSETIASLVSPSIDKNEVVKSEETTNLKPEGSVILSAPDEDILPVEIVEELVEVEEPEEEFAEPELKVETPEDELPETEIKAESPTKPVGSSGKRNQEPKPSASTGQPQLNLDF